jgi:type I restriction enzyme S subunit
MRLPAYSKYKPSGVEWLGDMPEHWDVKRLKIVATLTDKKVEADEDNPVLYIGMENIESWTGRLLPINADVVPTGTANEFKAGSTLFGKLRPYLAKVCNPDFDGLCSTELLVLESANLDRRTFLYLLLADGFIRLVDSSTYGSKMPRASWDFIGNCRVPVAPREEQLAISDFLDRETAKVDTLAARKRTLIERLMEKRTALISRTVTRGLPPDAALAAGLDPHPKLKPSGVDWLGDVPAHWDVSRIKYLAKIESGHTPSRSVDEYWIDCTIPWVSLNDSGYLRTHDYITDTVYQINELGLANSSARLLPARAVVFSRDATVGLCSITTRSMAVSQHFIAYICGPRLLPEYLLASLNVMGQHLVRLSLGATISTIGMDDIRSLVCAVPPYSEQVAVVDFLNREKTRLDRMVSRVETAINRLQEYRSALITAAVTGKIDARGAAAA